MISSLAKSSMVRSAAHQIEKKQHNAPLSTVVNPTFGIAQIQASPTVPLISAVENNDMTALRELIRDGRNNINQQDPLGETALMYAARMDMYEAVVDLLQAGAQSDVMNYEDMTARALTLDEEVDDVLQLHETKPINSYLDILQSSVRYKTPKKK